MVAPCYTCLRSSQLLSYLELNMQIWKNCTTDVLFYDETPAFINDEGYIVRLSDEKLEIAYDGAEGAVCYQGKNNGNGHFELKAPEINGQASVHCFPKSNVMEGYWQEGGERGMWRIHLK